MITVCIPAYRASAFIAQTVQSVLAQTFTDFVVHIAIDPSQDGPADNTRAALDPFEDDPRVVIRQNIQRFGWSLNIDTMIKTVETEFYVLLPHDDLWDPKFLETLFPRVSADDAVSVAYCDLETFGRGIPTYRSVVLPPEEDRGRHLLRFFLQGGHAMPWRGVTRTSSAAITRGFPSDRALGFAVECEYALGLLQAGRAVHVPEPLYKKRLFVDRSTSASRERRNLTSKEVRLEAWKRHRNEMSLRCNRLIEALGLPTDRAILCRYAMFAAMLMRRHTFAAPGLSDAEILVVSNAVTDCTASQDPLAPLLVEQLQALLALPRGASPFGSY